MSPLDPAPQQRGGESLLRCDLALRRLRARFRPRGAALGFLLLDIRTQHRIDPIPLLGMRVKPCDDFRIQMETNGLAVSGGEAGVGDGPEVRP